MQTIKNGARPAQVLLVEDSPADVKLTRVGCARASLDIDLHHVENGVACMAFLRREGIYADAPTPDLILLDLNMPVMDGREVLEALATDEHLRQIPVLVLTTSSAREDVVSSYKLGCSGYATKPVDLKEFLDLIESISTFYFSALVLPSGSGS